MIITIPGQTRAKKNSMKIIAIPTKGSRPCPTCGNRKKFSSLKSSTIYTKWEKEALAYLLKQNHPPWSGGYPLEIHFFLFRDSKRRWDIDNVFCGTLDVLQTMKIIEDDTANHVIPVFAGWAIDKKNPRVILQLKPVTKTYFREDLNVI
jgi:Holliday junction resolvase RusA-like endonuclease